MERKVYKLGKTKTWIWIFLIVFIIAIAGFVYFKYYFNFNNNKMSFSVDNVLLKLNVKEGDVLKKDVKLTNNEGGSKFNVKTDLDFVSFNESEFFLESNNKKNFAVNFNIKNMTPGIYSGNLIISKNKEELVIPVIIEIETKEILFDSTINVPVEYSDIYPGEKAIIENKILNLDRIGLKTLDVEYSLRSMDGKIIYSEQESIAVEDQVLSTKIIPIEDNVKTGYYVFSAIIKYKDSVGISSYLFRISDKKNPMIFGQNPLFLFIVLILILVLVAFFIYYLWTRDKLLKELHNEYKNELKRQQEIIRLREDKICSKLETPIEKEVYRSEIGKIRKQRIEHINKIYKQRVEEYKKIKKSKNKSELINQLKKWKSEGYNTEVLESKYRFPSVKEIQEKIKEWKSKGYDTSVLRK